MKRLYPIIIILVVVLLLSTLTGCGGITKKQGIISSSDVGWTIIESPITGRYYEVISTHPGGRAGMLAMSEVTEQEYLDYLESLK